MATAPCSPRRPFAALCVAALLLGFAGTGGIRAETPPAAAAAAPSPAAIDAADILRTIREGQASQHVTLTGQLRTSGSSSGAVFPFRLISNGPLVRYQFSGPPPVTVQVHYNEETSELEEVTGGGSGSTERMTARNFDTPILKTNLTFEDLALRFIYWSHATIEGDDRIKLRPAWKLLLTPATHRTQYSRVELWVDKESGGLVQAEAMDWQGRHSKHFEVVSVQKIADRWYLKQMRIESLDPASGKTRSRTYLEIKGVEQAQPVPAPPKK